MSPIYTYQSVDTLSLSLSLAEHVLLFLQVIFDNLADLLRCLVTLDECLLSNGQVSEKWPAFKR